MLTFDQLNTTTRTYLGCMGMSFINMKAIYDHIPARPLVHSLPNKKIMIPNPSEELKFGEILFKEYGKEWEGTKFKKSSKPMANCITIIIYIEKYHNIKLSNKGTIQMTGCTSDQTAIHIVQYIMDLILPLQQHWKYKEPYKGPRALIVPVMKNNSFDLGFSINREEADRYFHTYRSEGVSSLFEPSVGYIAVNCKIYNEFDREEKTLNLLEKQDGKWGCAKTEIYEYAKEFAEEEREKRITKQSWTTFLIFHNGKVIMSGGCCESVRRKAFEKFIFIVFKHKSSIEYIPIKEAKKPKRKRKRRI